jgi:hypothetical protein
VTQSALSPCFITYPATPASKFQTAECASYALSTITVIGTCLTLVYEGSSDSADPVSRKARKLAERQAQKKVTDLVDLPKEVVHTASGSCDSDESQDLAPTPAMNPFHNVMQHGRFPDAAPTTQQQRPEPAELTNAGNLWNAVPLRTCQYLDLEAAQVDSDTSEGSTRKQRWQPV